MAAIISAMTGVFTAVFTWVKTAITSVIEVFYTTSGTGESATGQLTFLGVLALVALAISIFFLLVGLIQNFLHLRG